MNQFRIYEDNGQQVTMVQNLFIDEYMKDANDAQIKVYLYLLRIYSAHLSSSISDIADQFNYTEKDILRALKYWESKKVISLDYDHTGCLLGIHLLSLTADRSSDSIGNLNNNCKETIKAENRPAPIIQMVSNSGASFNLTGKNETEAALASIQEEVPEKPSYSMDDLKQFKEREETAELLFIVEQYIGKPLTIAEIKILFYLTDKLSFSNDLIDYLVQYCVERGKKDFRYIEKVAHSWALQGITTAKEAKENGTRYDKTVYEILKALGRNGAPTTREIDYINKWTKEYAFDTELVLEACARTSLATDNHRFAYADGILSNWKKENIHHINELEALDKKHKKADNRGGGQGGMKNSVDSQNRFNQFPQNSYDFEALEKELLSSSN